MITTEDHNLSDLIVNNSNEGFNAFDLECRFTLWNPAMERISGIKKEDCLGKYACEVFPFLKTTGEEKYFHDALSGIKNEVTGREYDVPETGRKGYFDASYSPIYDHNGNIIGGLAVIRDVTKEKESLIKQKKFSDLLNSTQKIAHIGSWEVDLLTNEVFWTDEVYRIHELEIGTPIDIGKGINFYHPDYRETISDAIQNAINKKEKFDLDLKIITAKGREIWVRAVGKPVVKNGKVVALQGLFQDIDRERGALQTLIKSEERFHLAVNGTNDGIWDWPDIKEDKHWWSPRFYELLGYRYREIEASRSQFRALLHPEDLKKGIDAIEAHLSTNAQFDIEYRILTKSGEYKWFRERGQVIRDDKGQPVRMAGSISDIAQIKQNEEDIRKLNAELEQRVEDRTAQLAKANEKLKAEAAVREKTELALEKSKDLYQDLYDNAPDMYGSVDVKTGNLITCNQTFLNKLDYSRDEVIGNPILKVYHPDYHDEVQKAFTTFMATGKVMNAELQLESKNGNKIDVLLNVSAVRDESGGIVYCRSCWHDITNIKKIQDELKESEELFRLLADNATDMISKHTPEGVFTYASPSWHQHLGYTPEELMGRSVYELFHPGDLGAINIHKNVKEIPDVLTIAYRIKKKSGDYCWFETTCKSLRDVRNNEIVEIHCISRDVTERKEAEEQLKKNTQELESANKELESFSYSVSHDLRAPLRAIIGYSKILSTDFAGQLGEDGREITGYIIKNTGKMGILVDDLLAFSRLGRQDKQMHGFSMEDLVEEVINELKINHRDRNIVYQVDSLPNAVADPAMIKQVMANLLSNAVKFTGNKSQAIILVSSFSQDGEVVYKVQDNGVGFNMKYADKIFGVFQRLHSEAEFEGTGVGMALSQRIIQRHGGNIWAEGEPGKGAAFYFTLPENEIVNCQ